MPFDLDTAFELEAQLVVLGVVTEKQALENLHQVAEQIEAQQAADSAAHPPPPASRE